MDSGTMGCFLSIKLIEVFFLPTLLCGLDMNNMNEVKMLYNVHNYKCNFIDSFIALKKHLTAVFFEIGAIPTPTKSQNLTNCG